MSRPKSRASLIALVATAFALLLPAGASAATVVNGDFEDGNMTGWSTYSSNGAGDWLAYAKEPGQGIFTPPSGNWAAGGNQGAIDTTILYQDVALASGQSHRLALSLYYGSIEPIAVPTPNTLDSKPGADNQQLRVDVIRPAAALESLAPGDVLATAYASKIGDPEEMAPTVVGADLSALAGQVVRLRIAMAANQGSFSSGVDAVSITSTSPPPPAPIPPSNEFSRGKVQLTPGTGGGFLTINVPGPGVVKAVDARTKIATATARTSPKAIHKRIRRATKEPRAAGKMLVPLHPNSYGFKKLEQNGKLRVRVRVTYTPTGGLANTKSFNVTLKLAPSGGGPSR